MKSFLIFLKQHLLFLKTILVVFFIILLYLKVKDYSWDFHKIHFAIFPFILFLMLIPFNYYIEWLKWKVITKHNHLENKKKNLNAFASGLVSSFLTPSFSGNFIGRIVHYNKELKVTLTMQTFVANIAQSIIAISFGLFAFFTVYKEVPNEYFLVLFGVSILVYVFCNRVIAFLNIQYLHKIEPYLLTETLRLKLLALSFLRYSFFLAQYILVLWAFRIPPSSEVVLLVLLVFLFVTISPSFFFGKILLRESIAVGVFSLFDYDLNTIAMASLSIWAFSIFTPSILSILVIDKSKTHAYA